MANAKGLLWSDEEVMLLVEIWAEDGIQKQLYKTHKNAEIFSIISSRLKERGFTRTTEQCRDKLKKIRLQYLKVRDTLRRSGSSAEERDKYMWYNLVDQTIGNKPSTQPVVVESFSSTSQSTTPDSESGDGTNEPSSEPSCESPQPRASPLAGTKESMRGRKRKAKTELAEIMSAFMDNQERQFREFMNEDARARQREEDLLKSLLAQQNQIAQQQLIMQQARMDSQARSEAFFMQAMDRLLSSAAQQPAGHGFRPLTPQPTQQTGPPQMDQYYSPPPGIHQNRHYESL